MSISALALALYHSKATYSDRLVLISIANFEGEDGSWPAIDTISRLSGGINRRTVQRSIDSLVELGELREERRDGFTNRYHVVITCPDECDRSSNHRPKKGGGVQTTPVQIEQKGVASATKGGGVQTAGGAVSRPPEPLTNLKEQPLRTKRGHQLPNDWQPTNDLVEMFATKWPDVDQALHTENFKLHWWSTGGTKQRWDLTFQKWMNSEQDRAKKSNNRYGAKNDWNELDRWAKEQDEKNAD